MPPRQREQCAGRVLMVRPASFGYNPETALTNRFQQPGEGGAAAAASALALAEFDAMVLALEGEGIAVTVVDDTPEPAKPDAVFPNNWVSFHRDGTVVLYPMCAPSRRAERRMDIVDAVMREAGQPITRVVDLTHHEAAGRYLEGTGSLVLDHVERVAYACRSARTDERVLAEWSHELGYDVELFDATDAAGVPLYHTNVLMSIGSRGVVVGAEAIVPADRPRVLERLSGSGREVVAIGRAALTAFAGNMLELASWDEALGDCHVLVMSAAARASLGPAELTALSGLTDQLLAVPVPTIERLGGGSVRCMLAEVFWP